MWFSIFAWSMSHVGGGDTFGPGLWFVSNDLLLMGLVMFMFPSRIAQLGRPTPAPGVIVIGAPDAASEFIMRTAAACLMSVGWTLALFMTDSPALAPLGSIAQISEMLLGSGGGGNSGSATTMVAAFAAVVLTVHLIWLGVTGLDGLKDVKSQIRGMKPPFDRGAPELEALAAKGLALPVHLLGQHKTMAIQSSSVLLLGASCIGYLGCLEGIALFHLVLGAAATIARAKGVFATPRKTAMHWLFAASAIAVACLL
jgi:hypothetical protein